MFARRDNKIRGEKRNDDSRALSENGDLYKSRYVFNVCRMGQPGSVLKLFFCFFIVSDPGFLFITFGSWFDV